MSSNNKPLTKEELDSISNKILAYFGSRDNLQSYWKTTTGNELGELATREFGISLYRMKQVVLNFIQIEDKTKEDIKCLKQKSWETRPAYTNEQRESMLAKRKATCRKLYGVDNVFQDSAIKEKIRNACFERYGVYNINSSDENKRYKSELASGRSEDEISATAEKRQRTNLEKYGVMNPFQNEEIISKIYDTKEQRYGDMNFNNRAKAKETCSERYGTEYFSQTVEALETIKFRRYQIDDVYFDSYPELAIYIYCLHNKIPIQRNPIRLEYCFNDNVYYCFPDFKIDDRLVEVKGDHLYKKLLIPGTKDNAKFNCLIDNNVSILTFDKYKQYLAWFKKQGFKKEDYIAQR